MFGVLVLLLCLCVCVCVREREKGKENFEAIKLVFFFTIKRYFYIQKLNGQEKVIFDYSQTKPHIVAHSNCHIY